MIVQVLLAIYELRCYGVVHCDIKPSNILLADGDRFTVADLNSAVAHKSTVKEVSRATPYYSR